MKGRFIIDQVPGAIYVYLRDHEAADIVDENSLIDYASQQELVTAHYGIDDEILAVEIILPKDKRNDS